MVTKAVALLLLVASAQAACPPGTIFESVFNKCYKYVPQATNFLSAEKNCNSMGGTLASVSGSYENSFISGIAAATSPTPSYWIGINYLMTSRWSWTNGDNSTYMNFASGQPVDPSMYQCGAVRDIDNMWTKELCRAVKPYMCQIDPNAAMNNCMTTTSMPVTVPTTPSTGGPCPTGRCSDPRYTLNPTTCKCYKFYPGSFTNYNQSAVQCATDGGTMAIILNAADNSFVSSFARNASVTESNPWIGLWCTGSAPSSCRWADGSPTSYTNFAFGYPRANQATYLDEVNQSWYTFDSVSTGTYICQMRGIQMAQEARVYKQKTSLPNKGNQVAA